MTFRRLVIMLAFGISGMLFAGSASSETPVERHGALRVESGRLVDQSGSPVVLRGMSLF